MIAFLYWFWIELCYSRNGTSTVSPIIIQLIPLILLGFYPYPIFSLLNTTQRIGLFGASGFAMWAAGAGIRWCYRVLNGIEGEPIRMHNEEKKAN